MKFEDCQSVEELNERLRKMSGIMTREGFSDLLRTSLRLGIKEETWAEVSESSRASIRRWKNGRHLPAPRYRQTIVRDFSDFLEDIVG